ncbi:hypothetical protein N6G05_26655 [Cupriavidus gilardii]|nr:hypothetical protein [Cupriavidus gilardii]
MAITRVRRTARFDREYKSLSPELKEQADGALRDLFRDPIPVGRRFHALQGYRNPKLYTIDVTPNHAYKISLEIEGECATLRRVATHREIDRLP